MRALLLLLALSVVACADSPAMRGANARTPAGVPVAVPSWVPEDLRPELCAEVDAAGVPEGWTGEVAVPIFRPRCRDGLARGQCLRWCKRLVVGWRARPWEERPLLPALAHEVAHARRDIADD